MDEWEWRVRCSAALSHPRHLSSLFYAHTLVYIRTGRASIVTIRNTDTASGWNARPPPTAMGLCGGGATRHSLVKPIFNYPHILTYPTPIYRYTATQYTGLYQ